MANRPETAAPAAAHEAVVVDLARRDAGSSRSIALLAVAMAAAVSLGAGNGGCVGAIGDRAHEDAQGSPNASTGQALVSGLRRLTAYEYDRTLSDLLFDDAAGAVLNLPADALSPFDNDYAGQEVSQALIEGAELLAGDISSRLIADAPRRDAIVGCEPTAVRDEACFRSFLEAFGGRALRRPLAEIEIDDRMMLLDGAEEAGDFYFAVDLALRSFLQDPAFLYRVEIGEEVAPGVRRLDGWEVASRLSYLLWGSMPDDHLFDLAARGELALPDQVRAAALEMLGDPRALQQIERFHGMWMGYQGLVSGGALADAMRAETHALFDEVIGEGLPWPELFRWPSTFVTPELAEHYALPAPAAEADWVAYGDTGRAGLLSHASFLAIGGNEERTSPTDRGRMIRELLLCQAIAPPPPGVNASLPNEGGPTCKTDKYEAHTKGGCAGCHSLMDGIGFGLETYDGTGKFRTHEPDDPMTEDFDESQCALATDGELVMDDSAVPFTGPGELGTLLAGTDAIAACMIRQYYRFAVGRSELDDVDELLVDGIVSRLPAADLRFDEVVLELASHEAFLLRKDPEERP
jgi:hypothetical protein